jgi:hypothetical protein
MRWLFVDPTNRAEVEHRARTLRHIDAWWQSFSENVSKIEAVFAGEEEFDLPAWVAHNLSPIHPRLMWEFGRTASGDGHRLVITPESEQWLRPVVATLLERAPRLPRWEFHSYRQPEPLETALRLVARRTGENVSGTVFRASVGKAGRIDLAFGIPFCRSDDDPTALHAALAITECLLGEEVLDKRIGAITVSPPSEGWFTRVLGKLGAEDPQRWLGLEHLAPRVKLLIEGIVDQLPLQPCHEWIDDGQWAGIELSPAPKDDYPGRKDLRVAITGYLGMWQAAHSGRLFHSASHSRCSETFCYVKIAAADDSPADGTLRDRGQTEDAINAALKAAKLGCVIGGGTGLRYSYIDLALTDLRIGPSAVRDALQRSRVPVRTWILFFDDELAREYIGAYDETPAPP